MRNKWFILLCVILCFVLSACGAETPPETELSPDVNEVTATPGLHGLNEYRTPRPTELAPSLTLPAREDVLAVGVGIPGLGILGYTYAGTNELEKEAVLDLLYEADLSSFEVTENMTGGVSISYLLQTADESLEVEILTNVDVQWIRLTTADRKIMKVSPGRPFDVKTLDELSTQIRVNTEDPLHCGSIEIVGSGDTQKLNKALTAIGCGTLDIALETSEIAADESISYDVLFTVGELTYGINSETGHFYKEEAGEKAYAQLNEYYLLNLAQHLGLPGRPTPPPPQ